MSTTTIEARALDQSNPQDAVIAQAALEAESLANHTADWYGARLAQVPDEHGGGYVVWWTDYVANDWAEWFPSLAVAYVRFGALIDTGDRERWYTGTVGEFAVKAEALFESVTTA